MEWATMNEVIKAGESGSVEDRKRAEAAGRWRDGLVVDDVRHTLKMEKEAMKGGGDASKRLEKFIGATSLLVLMFAMGFATYKALDEGGREHFPYEEMHGVRDGYIEINRQMKVLCTSLKVDCSYVNAGKEANDGTGDTLWAANQKIAYDLSKITETLAQENRSPMGSKP